jgi:hypothetical protein
MEILTLIIPHYPLDIIKETNIFLKLDDLFVEY